MQNDHLRARLRLFYVSSNVVGLVLTALGSIILAWVGWLTWHDVTVWSKDLTLIFFESRTGEAISLGIDMKVIHYFLTGLALFFLGLLTFLRRRSKVMKPNLSHPVRQSEKQKGLSGCSHHFGYLRSLPSLESVPEECLTCQKMLECRNITRARAITPPPREQNAPS